MFEKSSAEAVPKFRERFEKLDKEVKEEVRQEIHNLLEKYSSDPWNHPRVKRIESMDVWRLKVGERGKKVDHRVFFDIEGSRLKFLTVRHRDQAYSSGI